MLQIATYINLINHSAQQTEFESDSGKENKSTQNSFYLFPPPGASIKYATVIISGTAVDKFNSERTRAFRLFSGFHVVYHGRARGPECPLEFASDPAVFIILSSGRSYEALLL